MQPSINSIQNLQENQFEKEFLEKPFLDLTETQQRFFVFLLLKKLLFNIKGKYLEDPMSQCQFYFEHNTPFSTLVDGILCALADRPIIISQEDVPVLSHAEKNIFSLEQLIDLSKVLLLLQERMEGMYNTLSISGQTLSERIQFWRTHCLKGVDFGLSRIGKEEILSIYENHPRVSVASLKTVAGLDPLTNASSQEIKNFANSQALPLVQNEIEGVGRLLEAAGQSHHWQKNPVIDKAMDFLTEALKGKIPLKTFERLNIPLLNLLLETSPVVMSHAKLHHPSRYN